MREISSLLMTVGETDRRGELVQEDNPLGIEDLTAGHSSLGAKMRSAVRDHRNQLCMHVRGMGA